MIQQLMLALALASSTVILHEVGTVRMVIPLTGLWKRSLQSSEAPRPVWTLTRLVSSLLIPHLAEMAIWGQRMQALDCSRISRHPCTIQ